MKQTINNLWIALMVFFAIPATALAQDDITTQQNQSTVETLPTEQTSTYAADNAYYQEWYAKYQEVGNQINTVSEKYQAEVEKRGYPKKKTVKAKMALVQQYIELLTEQLNDPRLSYNLDTKKVQDKIDMWNQQLSDLDKLLKKI